MSLPFFSLFFPVSLRRERVLFFLILFSLCFVSISAQVWVHYFALGPMRMEGGVRWGGGGEGGQRGGGVRRGERTRGGGGREWEGGGKREWCKNEWRKLSDKKFIRIVG